MLVAGFQGVSTAHEVTTLGRGGSDMTAVVLAAALGADRCEIYTDVDGVYTADPRFVRGARKLTAVSYDEMLELAASGAKVLQLRSVEFARNHRREAPRALVVLRGRRHVDHRGGRSDAGEGDDLGRHARARRDGLPRGGRPTGSAVRRARRGQRQRRHHPPDRRRHRLLGAAGRPRGGRVRARRARRDVVVARRPRQGLGRRSGNEEPPRRRGDGVRDARRARHPAGGGHHVADQDLLSHRRGRRRPRGGGAARRVRAGARRMPDARIAVVGATGAVGRCAARHPRRARLRRRAPTSRPRARPARSWTAGRSRRRRPRRCESLDVDFAFFAVGTSASRELVPHAVRSGAVCLDKSAAWRMEPGVPLVVPEVNGARAFENQGIVAVPNCCTIPLTCVLKPLHDAAGLARIRVATYQSVSGAGAGRMEKLRNEPQEEHDLGMDWDFDGEEFDEETKLREETRKIMELPDLPVSATCVRVPVMVGHAEAVWIETERPLDAERRARPARRGAERARRGRAVAGQVGRNRRRARRPHPPRPRGRRQRPHALPRVGQPPQGRRAERRADRGDAARARARSPLSSGARRAAPAGARGAGGRHPEPPEEASASSARSSGVRFFLFAKLFLHQLEDPVQLSVEPHQDHQQKRLVRPVEIRLIRHAPIASGRAASAQSALRDGASRDAAAPAPRPAGTPP